MCYFQSNQFQTYIFYFINPNPPTLNAIFILSTCIQHFRKKHAESCRICWIRSDHLTIRQNLTPCCTVHHSFVISQFILREGHGQSTVLRMIREERGGEKFRWRGIPEGTKQILKGLSRLLDFHTGCMLDGWMQIYSPKNMPRNTIDELGLVMT